MNRRTAESNEGKSRKKNQKTRNRR